MAIADDLMQALKDHGQAVGVVQGKRLFVVLFTSPSNGLMVALEKDGCFVLDDFDKPINAFDLVGAGFDFTSAPAVAEIMEALRLRVQNTTPTQAQIAYRGKDHE